MTKKKACGEEKNTITRKKDLRKNWEKSSSKCIYHIWNIEKKRKKEIKKRSNNQKAKCKAKKAKKIIIKVTQ